MLVVLMLCKSLCIAAAGTMSSPDKHMHRVYKALETLMLSEQSTLMPLSWHDLTAVAIVHASGSVSTA